MQTIEKYVPLEDLNDKEFYKKVKGEKFNESYHFGFLALDRRQRIIKIDSNPERVRALAIILGCEYPRVIGGDELSKKFYKEHNKRLEKALSNKN
jgi:hypothetical protein